MSGGVRKDIERLLDLARSQSWTVERAGSGHWKLRSPTGAIVILPFSPNSGRAYHYSRSLLRRHGLVLESKEGKPR